MKVVEVIASLMPIFAVLPEAVFGERVRVLGALIVVIGLCCTWWYLQGNDNKRKLEIQGSSALFLFIFMLGEHHNRRDLDSAIYLALVIMLWMSLIVGYDGKTKPIQRKLIGELQFPVLLLKAQEILYRDFENSEIMRKLFDANHKHMSSADDLIPYRRYWATLLKTARKENATISDKLTKLKRADLVLSPTSSLITVYSTWIKYIEAELEVLALWSRYAYVPDELPPQEILQAQMTAFHLRYSLRDKISPMNDKVN